MNHQDALDQLARETKRARRLLGLEQALRLGLPLLLAIGAWAAVAGVGVHERMPFAMQSVSAALALALFAVLWWRAAGAWAPPSEPEARARLARDSKFEVGVFDSLQDHPTRFDDVGAALWRRDRERALARVEGLSRGKFSPELKRVDPLHLRYVIALVLVAAFVCGGLDTPGRLSRAFLPDPGPLFGDRAMAIEAWATPANYTRESPVSLSDRMGERVATPPSVEATVRLTGPAGAPQLVFEGVGGRRMSRFLRAADGAWEARLAIPGAGRLRVVRFHTRAEWRIAPSVDAPPRAAFTAPMAQLSDENVSLGWRAGDDYGVRRLALRVRPISPPAGLARADPVDTDIETPTGDPREAQADVELDLADHPYAGMEVEARIVAFDALGQAGESAPMRFALPEKIFLQPLARAAIEIRRHILAERRAYRPAAPYTRRTAPAGDILLGNARIEVRDYDRRPALTRAPEGVRRAVRLVDALTMDPQDGYIRDLAVFLGFRTARSQLNVAREIAETNRAADTLWRTALRAEYGGAADARRALDEAQRQLAEALAQNAPAERIRQLVDALRRATENYMQALVQEALRNGERTNMEDTQDQTQLSEQDIEQMMREVQRLAEEGRTAEAQQMSAALAGILDNLDVRLAEQQEGGEGGDQEQQLQQSMDDLSETMGAQRALRDETREAQEQRQQDGQGGSGGEQRGGQGGDDLAQRQAATRQGLAEAQGAASESGAAPSNDLNAAGEAMRRAEEALQRGDLEGADAAQSAALSSLRQGAEALAAEMRERGRNGGREGEQGEAGAERDPLGRSSGRGDGEDANISTQSDPVRAREVFDEIRRRAEDPNRPEAEREYLRRLLDRFNDS